MNKYGQALQAVKALKVTPFDLLAYAMALDANAEADEDTKASELLELNLAADAAEETPVAVALTRRAQLFLED